MGLSVPIGPLTLAKNALNCSYDNHSMRQDLGVDVVDLMLAGRISKLTKTKWNGECRAATLIFFRATNIISKIRENDKRLISAHSRTRIRALQV
jgi:hypothetical protein